MFGNWKPDFLSAVPYFDKAAALFKAAGAPDQARDMYLKSADCNVCAFVLVFGGVEWFGEIVGGGGSLTAPHVCTDRTCIRCVVHGRVLTPPPIQRHRE